MIFDPVSASTSAKTDATSLRSLEGGTSAFGDQPALMFRNRCHDLNGEVVGVGQVHGDKLNAVLLKPGDERHGPSQTVELSDHQGCAMDAAVPQRSLQGGPIRSTTALDLLVLGHQLGTTDEPANSLLLGFEAQAALPLAFRGYAIVSHKAVHVLGTCLNHR